MDIIGTASGLASVGSFAFAVWVHIRKNGGKDRGKNDGKSEDSIPPINPLVEIKPKGDPVKPIKPPFSVAGVHEFVNNDIAYVQWLIDNPQGYVINTGRAKTPDYMVLHKAMCSHISNVNSREKGAFTERDFIKVCATDIAHLSEWTKQNGRSEGDFSSVCGACKPSIGSVSKSPKPGSSKTVLPSSASENLHPPQQQLAISDTEFASLWYECKGLSPAVGNYIVNDYVENLLLTVLDFMMQTPVVVKSQQHYLHHAKDAIQTHEDLTALLASQPDTKEGNTQIAQYLWGYKHWTRVQLLRRLMAYFETVGVINQEQLKHWAETTAYADVQGKVKGMGFAIYQWLVMRQGVETVKADIWVHRFIHRIIQRRVSDTTAVAVLEKIAQVMDVKAHELDWRIWEHERSQATVAAT